MRSAGAAHPQTLQRRLAEGLKQRFFLRFHVSLILLFTSASGVLATQALLWLGLETMWLRYLIAIAVAYGAFLLGVRLWLAYVGATAAPVPLPVPDAEPARASRLKRAEQRDGSGLPDLDFGLELPRGGGPSVEPFRAGGGGNFGGGGASASFADGDAGGSSLLSASSGSGGGGGGGGGGGLDLDIEGLAVLLLALLVLLLVLGGAAWLVWIGPEILTEAAFEAMLAGGLLKGLRGEAAGWVGRVVRRTVLPFALVTVAATAFAWVGQSAFPQARTAREVVRAALSGDAGTADGQAAPGSPPGSPAGSPTGSREASAAADWARLQRAWAAVQGVDASAPVARRAETLQVLQDHAAGLAERGRHDEAQADVTRGVGLVRRDDPLPLREAAADLQRLHAYRLGEAGQHAQALAAYAALRAWAGPVREPALAWRLVWSLNQSAVLQEQQVAEGSGLALAQEAAAYPVQGGDTTLVREIAEAWRLQGMVALWAAKREGLVAGAPRLATAITAFQRAVDRLPADAYGRGEALAGLAYARFLAGDRPGAAQALRAVSAEQAESTLALITDYTRHRTVPADAGLQAFVEPLLKR